MFQVNEDWPNAVDLIKAGLVRLVTRTAVGAGSFSDKKAIRRPAVIYRVPCIIALSAAVEDCLAAA